MKEAFINFIKEIDSQNIITNSFDRRIGELLFHEIIYYINKPQKTAYKLWMTSGYELKFTGTSFKLINAEHYKDNTKFEHCQNSIFESTTIPYSAFCLDENGNIDSLLSKQAKRIYTNFLRYFCKVATKEILKSMKYYLTNRANKIYISLEVLHIIYNFKTIFHSTTKNIQEDVFFVYGKELDNLLKSFNIYITNYIDSDNLLFAEDLEGYMLIRKNQISILILFHEENSLGISISAKEEGIELECKLAYEIAFNNDKNLYNMFII